MLEQQICAQFLDPITAIRTPHDRDFAELVDHYSRYIAAFHAAEGCQPCVLCIGSSASSFGTGAEMVGYFKNWFDKYPFVSIEDPFDQDDWEAYSTGETHTKALARKLLSGPKKSASKSLVSVPFSRDMA